MRIVDARQAQSTCQLRVPQNSIRQIPLRRTDAKRTVGFKFFSLESAFPRWEVLAEHTSSFLRKQESRCWFDWIPACAGMTRKTQQ